MWKEIILIQPGALIIENHMLFDLFPCVGNDYFGRTCLKNYPLVKAKKNELIQ